MFSLSLSLSLSLFLSSSAREKDHFLVFSLPAPSWCPRAVCCLLIRLHSSLHHVGHVKWGMFQLLDLKEERSKSWEWVSRVFGVNRAVYWDKEGVSPLGGEGVASAVSLLCHSDDSQTWYSKVVDIMTPTLCAVHGFYFGLDLSCSHG